MLDRQASLDSDQRERFAHVVESSLRVCRLSQFFLWTQGEVQTLLPHEILICGLAHGSGGGLIFRKFASTRYFRSHHFAEVCKPGDGLITRMIAQWRSSLTPCMVGPGTTGGEESGWLDMVEKNELKNIVAHGTRSTDGRVSSFFGFSRVGVALDERLSLVMHLLVPHLQTTFTRVVIEETRLASRSARARAALTKRELEVLRWIRDGKTNSDVAVILHVSPNTVKNHTQKILKKLSVENRSHAVARAISLGILSIADA
jgi:transcriptional regulator EpsA